MSPSNPPVSTANLPELEPIFISVKEAARLLDSTPWTLYQLLDKGLIESRYDGRRRKVLLTSVREYASGLPAERES